MESHLIVQKDSYHDSVVLMRISRDLLAKDGVADAVVAMGTPHNVALLVESGYDEPALGRVGPNDLVIAVRAEGPSEAEIESWVHDLLSGGRSVEASAVAPATLERAVQDFPESNLVLISVPGEHAAREARRALALGRHVMLFSDNVSVEDEVALKAEALERGLLMMGPDCGTAIINGKPLAFANVVRSGPIGVVGASGTGIQEITSCIHRRGGGISQAIGTGGRDLSDAVGGVMTLQGIAALAREPGTRAIVVVSKPPSPVVADRVIAALRALDKPAVVHFVGSPLPDPPQQKNVYFAGSLADAAAAICAAADTATSLPVAAPLPSGPLARGRTLCGLFCGGTTGQEALTILARAGLPVRSNLYWPADLPRPEPEVSADHVVLDLGDDQYTQGRPHPMIEPALRNEQLIDAVEEKAVGLLLFDVILGFGSHPDPAGVLAEGLSVARERVASDGRELLAIASITGTADDPQGYDAQQRTLVDAGIWVAPDNCAAARAAVNLLTKAR